MSELCIDASVAVKLVLKGEPFRSKARQLLKDCVVNNITLIAPPFFASETDTVIRKRVYDGKLSLLMPRTLLLDWTKCSCTRNFATALVKLLNNSICARFMTPLMRPLPSFITANFGRRTKPFMIRSKQRLLL